MIQTQLNLVQTDQRYKELDEDAAQTIIKCTNIKMKLNVKEGKVDMCKAIEDLEKEHFSAGEQQGLERGLEQGLEQGLTRGVQALINICRSFELKYEDVKARIISELAVKDDEAERYMQKYW